MSTEVRSLPGSCEFALETGDVCEEEDDKGGRGLGCATVVLSSGLSGGLFSFGFGPRTNPKSMKKRSPVQTAGSDGLRRDAIFFVILPRKQDLQ